MAQTIFFAVFVLFRHLQAIHQRSIVLAIFKLHQREVYTELSCCLSGGACLLFRGLLVVRGVSPVFGSPQQEFHVHDHVDVDRHVPLRLVRRVCPGPDRRNQALRNRKDGGLLIIVLSCFARRRACLVVVCSGLLSKQGTETNTVCDTRQHTPWTDFQCSVTPHQARFQHQTTRFRKAVAEIFATTPCSGPTTLVDVEQSSFKNRSWGCVILCHIR